MDVLNENQVLNLISKVKSYIRAFAARSDTFTRGDMHLERKLIEAFNLFVKPVFDLAQSVELSDSENSKILRELFEESRNKFNNTVQYFRMTDSFQNVFNDKALK